MTLHPTWPDLALRLVLAALAAGIIGVNRSERGRPAGIRTTMLVCVAAALAMIQANLLLATVGKSGDSFVQLDILRFPLGILSGIGFIGAGVILRRGDLVTGVTTAATMWFVTVLGLCFGSGQIFLGLAGHAIALVILGLLPMLERRLPHDYSASFELSGLEPEKLSGEIESALGMSGFKVAKRSLAYRQQGRSGTLGYELTWPGRFGPQREPAFIAELSRRDDVQHVKWAARDLTAG